MTGYSSDDINKFLWPVRIGSGVFPNDMPGERDYLSDGNETANFNLSILIDVILYVFFFHLHYLLKFKAGLYFLIETILFYLTSVYLISNRI